MTYNPITANSNADLALLFSFKILKARLYCVSRHFIEQICASAPITLLTTSAVVDISRKMTTTCTFRTRDQRSSASISCSIAPQEPVSRVYAAIYRHKQDSENGIPVARYKDINQPVADW
jgi:hypothetical protein